MLYDFFKCNQHLAKAEIRETIEHLNVKFSSTSKVTSEFITKFVDELKTISNRDQFELFLVISGNNEKITDTSKQSLNILLTHINENDLFDEFEIELIVRKTIINSTLSIYFIDSFFNGLINSAPENVIISLSRSIDEHISFEVFSTIQEFYSRGMLFFPSGIPINNSFTPPKKRQSQLEMSRDNCGALVQNINLLPSDFYLEVESETDEINDFFYKLSSVLSLSFISNSLSFAANNCICYKMNGYKTVLCDNFAIDELVKNGKLLYKIYSWVYEGGNSVDKLGLVRNVLSIHLDSNGKIRFDNEAWEAIQSNYQVYLKDNIQSYLEIKNKIGEFIIDATTKTYSMADELLESLKNNVLVLLTFILTVVLVNGLKDNGSATVFSNSYLLVVVILSLLSAFWLIMSRTETMNRFDSTSETIKDILKLNYDKVIMEGEINSIVDPVISKNRAYLASQLSRYTYWWSGLLIMFVFIFGVANRVIAWSESNSITVDYVIKLVGTESKPYTSTLSLSEFNHKQYKK